MAQIDRALALAPNEADTHVSKARILNVAGPAEEAEKSVRLAMRLEISVGAGYAPLTVEDVAFWWYGQIFAYDEVYRERLMAGLRKAGVPEGAGTDIKYADFKRLIRDSAGEYEVEGATKIDAAKAKALHAQGVVFVDVPAAPSFNLGHIPNAVNLDMNIGLSKESLSRLVGKDDEVVFSCVGKYCPYSAYGCAKAIIWGYTRVYYFASGFPAWKNAGYPVETSSPRAF